MSALVKYSETKKQGKTPNLLDDDDIAIQLVVTLKKIPEQRRTKPYPMYDLPSPSICVTGFGTMRGMLCCCAAGCQIRCILVTAPKYASSRRTLRRSIARSSPSSTCPRSQRSSRSAGHIPLSGLERRFVHRSMPCRCDTVPRPRRNMRRGSVSHCATVLHCATLCHTAVPAAQYCTAPPHAPRAERHQHHAAAASRTARLC